MPKLIGIVKLETPFFRKTTDGGSEQISHIAYDVDGGPWGLVTQAVPLEDSPDVLPSKFLGRIFRQNDVRWERFDALPFVDGKSEGWQ